MNTIERLVPDQLSPGDATGQATLDLHCQRYEFAARHLRAGRLLDIASGVGYGTFLLGTRANSVTEAIGVDLSPDAIAYARQRYASEVVRFVQHDAMSFTDEKGFDTIVSIETLEHISDPAGLVLHLIDLLHSHGVLIASVPTTPSMDVNPYHMHDFSEHSFREMMTNCGLREIAHLRQVQPYPLVKTLLRKEPRMKDMRQNLVGYYFRHPAGFIKRIWSTLWQGFTNRYITIVWQKDE
jgi:SAM-dependent methyltransferase